MFVGCSRLDYVEGEISYYIAIDRPPQWAKCYIYECNRIYHITYMLEIREHRALMTILVESWHIERSTFIFLTGEATITLEDVWRISIASDHVIYDIETGEEALQHFFHDNDLDLEDDEMDLRWWVGRYDDLPLVLGGLIFEIIVPNSRSWEFFVG